MKPLIKLNTNTRENDDIISNKINNLEVSTIKLSGGNKLLNKISDIRDAVRSAFADRIDTNYSIQSEEDLNEYVDNIIELGECAIDIETDGLDIFNDKIAGICLYSPNNIKPCYIPVNHIDYLDHIRIDNQLDEEIVKSAINKMISCGVKFRLYNAKFDCKVLKWQWEIDLPVSRDGYIGMRLLDENNIDNSLKAVHTKFVKKTKAVAYNYGKLFDNLPSSIIPIKEFSLYAANDAIITWEVIEFQEKYLGRPYLLNETDNHMYGVSWHYLNIELPYLKVIIDMELRGIGFDEDTRQKLAEEYVPIVNAEKEKLYEEFKLYKDEIDAYIRDKNVSNVKCKLEWPINPSSTDQLVIFLYDIMKIDPPVSKKGGEFITERNTKKETLEILGRKYPICNSIIKYREFEKLVGTFINNLDKYVNKRTGRVHSNFNQYQARTGRQSSNDPNLQQIPSKGKHSRIRNVFVPSEGNVLISSDFSSQEVRLCAHFCKDEKMRDAIVGGKDLYSFCASILYKCSYEECLEFADKEKTIKNPPEYKQRRSNIKAIFLGIMYGKGIASIAQELGVSYEDAKNLYETVLTQFPKLKDFMKSTQSRAKKSGYVSTITGRKCRIPEIQLSKYEYFPIKREFPDLSDEFMESFGAIVKTDDDFRFLSQANSYKKMLEGQKYIKFEVVQKIIKEAAENGIRIKNNTKTIADMERKCVNSIIQGSAADQLKMAMITLFNDKRLNELGYKLLVPLHDEVLGECPIENSDEVVKIVREIFIGTFSDILTIPR